MFFFGPGIVVVSAASMAVVERTRKAAMFRKGPEAERVVNPLEYYVKKLGDENLSGFIAGETRIVNLIGQIMIESQEPRNQEKSQPDSRHGN